MELTGHGVCFSDRKSTTQWNTRILYGTTTFRCAIRRSRGLNRRLDCKSCNQRQQRSRTFDRPLKIAGRCSILNVELMVTYGLRNEGGNILNCSVLVFESSTSARAQARVDSEICSGMYAPYPVQYYNAFDSSCVLVNCSRLAETGTLDHRRSLAVSAHYVVHCDFPNPINRRQIYGRPLSTPRLAIMIWYHQWCRDY